MPKSSDDAPKTAKPAAAKAAATPAPKPHVAAGRPPHVQTMTKADRAAQKRIDKMVIKRMRKKH